MKMLNWEIDNTIDPSSFLTQREKILGYIDNQYELLYILIDIIIIINDTCKDNARKSKKLKNFKDKCLLQEIFKKIKNNVTTYNGLDEDIIYSLYLLDYITLSPKDNIKYLYAGSKALIGERIRTGESRFGFIHIEHVCQDFFLGIKDKADIFYLMMTYLQSKYSIKFSPNTVRLFNIFAEHINALYADLQKTTKSRQRMNIDRIRFNWEKIETELLEIAEKHQIENIENIVYIFFQVSFILKLFEPSKTKADTLFVNGYFDINYFILMFYGLKTSIPGFDDLFGGGLLLPSKKNNYFSTGKIILLHGEYGSGKTILSSQIAFEIAQKGGISFIFALEQDIKDLVMQYYSFGWLPKDNEFFFTTQIDEFLELANNKSTDKGLLGVGNISKIDSQEHFDAILSFISQDCFKFFNLRLIVIDPINSVILKQSNLRKLRSQTNNFFNELKENAVDAIFTTEYEDNQYKQFRHEHNISDYVIRLWSEEYDNLKYKQRFIEVTKSRGQSTHRGRQAFSIVKNGGCHIYLSSPAFLIQRSQRRSMAQDFKTLVKSGIEKLDNILNPNNQAHLLGGFLKGDIITYSGEGSSGKTNLALLFLLQKKSNRASKSLLITFNKSEQSIFASIEHDGAIRKTLRNEYGGINIGFRNLCDSLDVITMDGGYIRPGQFFQKMLLMFDSARKEGKYYDKIVIDNIRYMEENCPLISNDKIFVTTLIKFLRTENCTSIIVCSGQKTEASRIQQEILESSDCIINFNKIDFKGDKIIAFNILRSSFNRHDKRTFELKIDPELGLSITHQLDFLKNPLSDKQEFIRIRLFLHSETKSQSVYNESLQFTLKNTLVPNVIVHDKDIFTSLQMSDLGMRSSFDELQIVQIDEHQLPFASKHWLRHFILDNSDKLFKSFSSDILNICHNYDHIWAFPFYGNPSFLLINKSIADNFVLSWENIAELCKSQKELVFDFPKETNENFNCLFLEILHSQNILASNKSENICLKSLLNKKPLIRKVIQIFWKIGHKSFSMKNEANSENGINDKITINTNAQIIRTWYTIYNNLYNNDYNKIKDFVILPLPSEISCSGDWYLGVTKFSAATDIGFDIIRMLASANSAQGRFENGLGIPLNNKFIKTGIGTLPLDTNYDHTNFMSYLYNNSKMIRRSQYGCYFMLSGCLAFYLKSILKINTYKELNASMNNIINKLNHRLNDIWSDNEDRQCFAQSTRICKESMHNKIMNTD